MKTTLCAIAALAAVFGSVAVACADDAQSPPPPDKSRYDLFNPTPDDQLRSLCTDRPTKSTGPCTVDAGHVQVESDVFNITYDHEGGVDTTTSLYTNPTFKLGLTNTLDFEVNIAPWQTVDVKDKRTGVTTHASGVGDLYLRAKQSLIGDDGGDVAIAIDPYVKVPTAPLSVGNGAVEGGIVVPIQINLPANFQLSLDPEVDVLKDAVGDGRHANLIADVSLGYPLTKTVTVFAEIWGDVDEDPAGQVDQATFDLAAAWIPAKHPTFQLDGGVNFGLNNQTPAAQVYLGVSKRF
jgi:hypothetical protein